VEATHNLRFKIEVLALTALLEEALGREEAALSTLGAAVTLAAPTGLLRVFVDQGPHLARLLDRLAAQKTAPEGIAHILRAFPPQPSLSVHPSAAAPQPGLIEPLTYRELEVLEMLAQRLSAKEIAQRLVISNLTAKRHTANIYQKLGVNSRQQAVTAATALGILPGHP
jgi:LuxR family maltose regulon positive regulatory protein